MVRKIIDVIATILSFVFNFQMTQKIKTFDLLLHSAYLRHFFASCGDGFIAGRDITIENPQSIIIGKNVTIGRHCVITSWNRIKPNIIIEDGVSIGDESHISSLNLVRIGKDVLIARKVTITDNSHGNIEKKEMVIPPIKRNLVSKGHVVIGNNVWIGEKATILANVSIGECSIVGANAVVTKDVKPFTVVAGNPAKIIKVL